MTILNKSIFPELAITPDETYDSPNATAWLNSDGLRIKSGGVKLEAGTSLVLDSTTTVVGLVTPSTMASALSGKADSTAVSSALAGKVDTSAMAAALALKADASTAKRIDTYSGTTDSNGLFTVVYPTPFAATPSVQPEPPALANQVWTKVSSSATGFQLQLKQRNTVNLLSTELLLGTTVNAGGVAARVVVISA